MKNKYEGIVIADIHCGAIPYERMYEEVNGILFDYMNKQKKLDYIICDGDFFHHKLFLNDKYSSLAYKLLSIIIKIAKEHNAPVRFVYGTESHECDQYEILNQIKESDNVKVIKHVCEEELLPDLKVLYLPEESIYNKEEYYKEFFEEEDKYDYIFGHGVVREVMKEAAVISDNSGNNRRKVPVFSTAELARICKGQIYFGHYHMNVEIDDKFFYVSSFTRWQFGEEGRKGFYHMTKNLDNGTYKNNFIENTMAETYTTIGYAYDNKAFKSIDNMEESLNHVKKMVESQSLDHVRFEFNVPTDCENPEFMINFLNEKFKFNEKTKVNIVHGYVEEKKKKDKEAIREKTKKYGFIFDKNMKLEDKCSHFISIEYNKDISPERSGIYLYKSLNEILSLLTEEGEDTNE